jgi:Phage integrase family.
MSAIPTSAMESFRERVVGRSVSKETFAEYERWIKRFEAWNPSEEPGLPELEDFDTLLNDGSRIGYPWDNARGPSAPDSYAYRTRIIAISAVKMWIRRHYGVRVPEEPDDIVMGEQERFDPTYLPRSRIPEIIDAAPEACGNDGCKAALALSYDAILRAVELTRLEYNDITLPDEAGGTALVDVPAAKGSRASTLSVSDATGDLLARHLDPDAPTGSTPLFTNTHGNPWSRNAWASHVIEHHCPEGSHAFGRHSPILHMMEEEGFGPTYRRARHQNPQTTAKYARLVGESTPEWASG